MRRSWVFVFYDAALLAVLMLPLATVAALISGRMYAAMIYILALTALVAIAFSIAHLTRVTPRTYLRSIGR